jgi:hypothetical protein
MRCNRQTRGTHNRLVDDGPCVEPVITALNSGFFFRFAGLTIEESGQDQSQLSRADSWKSTHSGPEPSKRSLKRELRNVSHPGGHGRRHLQQEAILTHRLTVLDLWHESQTSVSGSRYSGPRTVALSRLSVHAPTRSIEPTARWNFGKACASSNRAVVALTKIGVDHGAICQSRMKAVGHAAQQDWARAEAIAASQRVASPIAILAAEQSPVERRRLGANNDTRREGRALSGAEL